VNPGDYKVVVYIYVNYVQGWEGWWGPKPYYTSPLNGINSDGSWTCDITTGGDDAYATRIKAFLVPNSCTPPELGRGSGEPNLGDAVAQCSASRSP
jgi:hypothetical protein